MERRFSGHAVTDSAARALIAAATFPLLRAADMLRLSEGGRNRCTVQMSGRGDLFSYVDTLVSG